MASAGRFPERRRKLIHHRLYLEHYTGFPGQPRELLCELSPRTGHGLYHFHLHVSHLGEGQEGKGSNCSRRVTAKLEGVGGVMSQKMVANFVRQTEGRLQ